MFSSDENRNDILVNKHTKISSVALLDTQHDFIHIYLNLNFPRVLEFSSKIPLMLRLSIQYSFVRTWHILLVWETIYRKYRLDKQLFITTHIAQILFEYKKLGTMVIYYWSNTELNALDIYCLNKKLFTTILRTSMNDETF